MADIIPLFNYDEDRERLRGQLLLAQKMMEIRLRLRNEQQMPPTVNECNALVAYAQIVKREWWQC